MKSNLSNRVRGRVVAHALLAGCALSPLTVASAHARPDAATPVGAPRAPGAITGTVSQAGSGEYLDGASVSIPALDLSTVVDRTGRFSLVGVPAGTHELVIRYVGFPDARRTVTVADGPVTLDVAMSAVVGTDAGAGVGAGEGAEIVVSGSRPIAESESAALQIQRTSPSLVSVIASDSIGRLPDQNVAQAVSRLPGVGVQRDQGQARYITLRGAPINWTRCRSTASTSSAPKAATPASTRSRRRSPRRSSCGKPSPPT